MKRRTLIYGLLLIVVLSIVLTGIAVTQQNNQNMRLTLVAIDTETVQTATAQHLSN